MCLIWIVSVNENMDTKSDKNNATKQRSQSHYLSHSKKSKSSGERQREEKKNAWR